MCKLFFEIHDFEQEDGQGNDIGTQYLSAIFVVDKNQEEIAKKLILILENKGFEVATKIYQDKDFGPEKFSKAEKYHQNYYQTNGQKPYCHFYKKKF